MNPNQLRQRDYLLKISRAMTSRLDLPSLLRLILTSAGEMVGAEAGLVALRQGNAKTLTVYASYGIPPALLPRLSPLLTGVPLQVDGFGVPDLEARVEMVSRAIRLPLRQVIALPLVFDDYLLGVIYLFRLGGAAFTANDRDVLASFADQAAIAVRNAQLYQQVNSEKQQLDAIIEHSADGVMILDPELRIEVFNRALSRLTGWPADQAIGRPCYEVLNLEQVTGQNLCGCDPADVSFPEGKPVAAEGWLVRPGGSRVAVSVTYSPLYDDGGGLSRIIANVVDISRFKEAEEMKSTFVSVISHELKTPVSVIKGYANTLAREDAHWDAATLHEGLEVISEESDRLNGLINDLLDASRIQAGGFRLDRADVNLPRLAASVAERSGAQGGAHSFVLDFPEPFPAVVADEERLRQVLNNLVGNALKYSPQGGEIRIGGWSDGDTVTVYVADQGIGIPAEEQSNLFQRFYRVDSSLRRSTQGAGLGLYLCKTIVEAHDGQIWLASEPGKGTTVFFTLPVDAGSEGE